MLWLLHAALLASDHVLRTLQNDLVSLSVGLESIHKAYRKADDGSGGEFIPASNGRPHIHDYNGAGVHLKTAGLTALTGLAQKALGQDHITMESGGSGGGEVHDDVVLTAFAALKQMEADPGGTTSVVQDVVDCQEWMERHFKTHWGIFQESGGTRVVPEQQAKVQAEYDADTIEALFSHRAIVEIVEQAYAAVPVEVQHSMSRFQKGSQDPLSMTDDDNLLMPPAFLEKIGSAIQVVLNKYGPVFHADFSGQPLPNLLKIATDAAVKMRTDGGYALGTTKESPKWYYESQAANQDNSQTYIEKLGKEIKEYLDAL